MAVTKSMRWALPVILLLIAVGYCLRSGDAMPPAPVDKSQRPLTPMQPPAGRQIATLAGGCFWSMEAMFVQLKGVDKVLPGYAGGGMANPEYEQVCRGNTGHAETINIVFDPKVISYGDLLHIFMNVHNPTTLNQQGPDRGTQYRSAIFYHGEEQHKAALAAIQEIEKAKVWNDPVVTEVEEFSNFYRAEEYHLDYFKNHPEDPYCKFVVAPKVQTFQDKFKEKLKG